jgi:uncharacterized protein
VQPVLHLSLPVRDLDEARQFYVGALGCEAGRRREGYLDMWFYGMQITLHDRPDEVDAGAKGGVRHFGVSLGRDDFDALTARLAAADVEWVVPVSTDDPGLPTEQTKAKVADPSGNVIEIKTYADLAAALEVSAHSYPGSAQHGN